VALADPVAITLGVDCARLVRNKRHITPMPS
jgi:hypothetical protein